MKKADLIDLLRNSDADMDADVVCHIQGECYYPIVKVENKFGKQFVVLVCPDIKKVEE